MQAQLCAVDPPLVARSALQADGEERLFRVQSQGSNELVYSSNSKGALYCDVDVELQNKWFKAMKRVNGAGILGISVYSFNFNHVCGPMHRAKTMGDRKSIYCGKKTRAVTVKKPSLCQQVANQKQMLVLKIKHGGDRKKKRHCRLQRVGWRSYRSFGGSVGG
jgi:hypothetical protein